ncbi:MAG: glycosyltransferase [Candidatus Electrothrix sp. AR4]|nr:glycosyltransferase [Candidatus Electrothrix sp. AR4]
MNTTATLISLTLQHMGQHSGYDLLCPALQFEGGSYRSIWLDDQLYKKFLKVKIANCALRNFPNKTNFYRPKNFWAELEACVKSFRSSKIIHILYGENNLGIYAIPCVKCRKKLVVTIHQPLSWWKDHGLDIRKKFQSTDALIVLSSAEKENFGKILGNEKLHFIPHGIDTEFFSPPPPLQLEKKLNSARKRCLFVGQWLRDFKTLFAVMDEILRKDDDIFFDLVVINLNITALDIEKRLVEFERHPQVSRHQNLDDAALLDLYRNATLLFLPLEESTANNAVLEAMACGLPIVTNYTSGILDYIDDTFAYIYSKNDSLSMIDAIYKIASDKELQRRMSKNACEAACEKFTWSAVAGSVKKIYKKLS